MIARRASVTRIAHAQSVDSILGAGTVYAGIKPSGLTSLQILCVNCENAVIEVVAIRSVVSSIAIAGAVHASSSIQARWARLG